MQAERGRGGATCQWRWRGAGNRAQFAHFEGFLASSHRAQAVRRPFVRYIPIETHFLEASNEKYHLNPLSFQNHGLSLLDSSLAMASACPGGRTAG